MSRKNKWGTKIFLLVVFVIVGGIVLIYVTRNMQTPSLSFDQKLTACGAIPNNSVQYIDETTRLFINLPRDIYPDKEYNLQFKTVHGNATAGWISNAGPYGEAFPATSECWSYYYEFNGNGEIELCVQSAIPNTPNYVVRFVVGLVDSGTPLGD